MYCTTAPPPTLCETSTVAYFLICVYLWFMYGAVFVNICYMFYLPIMYGRFIIGVVTARVSGNLNSQWASPSRGMDQEIEELYNKYHDRVLEYKACSG